MIYLLDTNACISHLRFGIDSNITEKLASVDPGDVVLCSVVRAELLFGAMRSRDVQRNVEQVNRFLAAFTSLPFDDKAAAEYGRIRAQLTGQGTIIGPNDLMIAAITLANDLTLVTHNTAEFGRVPGLRHEDWEASSSAHSTDSSAEAPE